jgi:hypothetical protein
MDLAGVATEGVLDPDRRHGAGCYSRRTPHISVSNRLREPA